MSQKIRIAAAGEALVDFIGRAPSWEYSARLGGAVFNTSVSLARQGVGCAYLNPLSNDHFGQAFYEQALELGLASEFLQRSKKPTSLAIALLNASGQAHYSFYRDSVADREVSAAMLTDNCAKLTELEAVFCGCLALSPHDREHYLPWLATSREQGLAVVLDLNLRLFAFEDRSAYRANIFAATQHAHLIKLSDEDLADLLGLPLCASTEELLSQCHRLFEQSPAACLLLTMGEKGAFLLSRSGQTWHGQETRRLQVADTIGAGDCFAAGFLASLMQQGQAIKQLLAPGNEQTWLVALRHAIASASYCVEQTGCLGPNFETAQARGTEIAIQKR